MTKLKTPEEAVCVLSGGIVVLVTDTIYGVLDRALNSDVVNNNRQVK